MWANVGRAGGDTAGIGGGETEVEGAPLIIPPLRGRLRPRHDIWVDAFSFVSLLYGVVPHMLSDGWWIVTFFPAKGPWAEKTWGQSLRAQMAPPRMHNSLPSCTCVSTLLYPLNGSL